MGWFEHFPHAAEILLPCWSYFMSHGAENNCGLLLQDKLQLPPKSWQDQLVRAMGCDVAHEFLDSEFVNSSKLHYPNIKWMHPRYNHRNYLLRPEHAQELRRRVIPDIDDTVAQLKGPNKPLRIGLLNRDKSRVITNMDGIEMGLKEALPNGTIFDRTFLDHNISVQAMWFATKDLIIATHGAALANAIFLTPGTIVIQPYPPGFHWQSMDPLIEQAGGVAMDWFEGENPLKIHFNNQDDWNLTTTAQHRNFSIPVEEMIDLVLVALDMKNASNLTKYEW